MAPTPAISFITTCKGRLAHLEQSLPLLIAQPRSEVIIVDYDCPDGAGAWVADKFPQAKVVHVTDAPIFNLSRARNLGAQAATAEWLCFVDADKLIAAGFVEHVLPLLRGGAFFTLEGTTLDVSSMVVCKRSDHRAAQGYDEVLQGWGGEDDDFHARLRLCGLRQQTIAGEWVRTIAHDNAIRVRYYETKDVKLNQRVNWLYIQIKHDLSRLAGRPDLPLDTRRAIYSEVEGTLHKAAASPRPAARFELTLPDDLLVPIYGWKMKRVWTYTIEPAARE